MLLLRRVSQPAIFLGCEDTIRFSNTIRTFVIFCITANDFGEVYDRNAHWLKVPL